MDYFILICKGGTEAESVEGLADVWCVGDVKCFWVEEMRKPKHRKSGGLVAVSRPRWPRYLFVQLKSADLWQQLKVVRTIRGMLTNGEYPLRMREWQFQRLVAEIEGNVVEGGVVDAIEDGTPVRIAAGQFVGIEGIFRNKNVELLLFGKKVKYHIDEEFLIRLD